MRTEIETLETGIVNHKNRIPKLSIGIIFILFLTIFSCDKQRVYENYYSMDGNGWDKDSILTFSVEIKDITSNYNIFLNCRNLENYPYSNLWFYVDIISPNATAIRDTVEYTLAQPNGKWIGRGTSGVYANQFVYRSNVFFPSSGIYEISIQHGMRNDLLKGVKDIGLRVEKK